MAEAADERSQQDLEVLQHKPGALGGSTALAHARNTGAFTGLHEGFWAESRKVNGDAAGTRELIDVLLLHRTMPTPAVLAGISAALTVGAVTADVVAVEARLAAAQLEKNDIALIEAPTLPKVVSLTQRRLTDPAAVIAGLPQDNRPLPSVAGYDALLTKRAAKHAVTASMSEGASGA